MNNLSLYIFLIVSFLGLSATFFPNEQETPDIRNPEALGSIFHGAPPVEAILVDAVRQGLIIKTHYHKYLMANPFSREPYYLVFRTSRAFWRQNIGNIGMSIFRRNEKNEESIIPMPPGTLFMGNPAYGNWHQDDNGKKYWKFHNSYNNLYTQLGWGDWRPNAEFIGRLQLHQQNNIPFHGLNHEFGTDGSLTQKTFLRSPEGHGETTEKFYKHLKRLFSLQSFQNKAKEKK